MPDQSKGEKLRTELYTHLPKMSTLGNEIDTMLGLSMNGEFENYLMSNSSSILFKTEGLFHSIQTEFDMLKIDVTKVINAGNQYTHVNWDLLSKKSLESLLNSYAQAAKMWIFYMSAAKELEQMIKTYEDAVYWMNDATKKLFALTDLH